MTATDAAGGGDGAPSPVRAEAEAALLSFLGESPDAPDGGVPPWLAAMRAWREREAMASAPAGC